MKHLKYFENIDYTKSNYTQHSIGKSRIDSSQEIIINSHMLCPICGNILDDMGHADVQQCVKCKNTFQSYGNSLCVVNKPHNIKTTALELVDIDYSDPKKIKERLSLSVYENGKYLTCPFCKKQLKIIKHGQTKKCSCGLEMTVYGNSLYCTLDSNKVNFQETIDKYNL